MHWIWGGCLKGDPGFLPSIAQWMMLQGDVGGRADWEGEHREIRDARNGADPAALDWKSAVLI